MKIPFSRIGNEDSYTVEKKDDKYLIDAIFSFQIKDRNLLHSLLKIRGSIKIPCNSCLETVSIQIEEDIEFLLSDGVYKGFHDEFDVVEIFGGVSLEEILLGELELLESGDYHKCESCQNIELDLEF
jgi:hypothetical protein